MLQIKSESEKKRRVDNVDDEDRDERPKKSEKKDEVPGPSNKETFESYSSFEIFLALDRNIQSLLITEFSNFKVLFLKSDCHIIQQKLGGIRH